MRDEHAGRCKGEHRGAWHEGTPMSTPHPPGETERDPWLAEALRHAPDADAAPPAVLSDAILREARAAAGASGVDDEARSTHHARGRSTSPTPASMWASAWAWLLRPPVASGFATALVAVLVGVMWQGRTPEETQSRAPAADASPSAAAPVASTSIASVPVPGPTPRPGPAPAPAPGSVPVPVPEVLPRKEAAIPRDAPTAPSAAPPAHAEAGRMPSPGRQPAAQAKGEAPRPSRAAVPPDGPVRDKASTDLASEQSAPSSPAFAFAPAPASPVAPRQRESVPAAAAAAADSAADRRAASAEAALQGLAKATPTRSNDLEALRAAIDADPTRWRWQRGETSQPMTPALRSWLAQLAAATASRWRLVPATAAFDEATVLKLYRDDTLTATLHLGDTGVRLDGGWQATLTADSLAALRQALEAASR